MLLYTAITNAVTRCNDVAGLSDQMPTFIGFESLNRQTY